MYKPLQTRNTKKPPINFPQGLLLGNCSQLIQNKTKQKLYSNT